MRLAKRETALYPVHFTPRRHSDNALLRQPKPSAGTARCCCGKWLRIKGAGRVHCGPLRACAARVTNGAAPQRPGGTSAGGAQSSVFTTVPRYEPRVNLGTGCVLLRPLTGVENYRALLWQLETWQPRGSKEHRRRRPGRLWRVRVAIWGGFLQAHLRRDCALAQLGNVIALVCMV